MSRARRTGEIVAIVVCSLALRELTTEVAKVIGYRWASLPFFAMWFVACAAASYVWGWPRWWPARSAWSRRNLVVFVGVLVATDYLYGFKLPRIVAGDYAFHAPYTAVYFIAAAIAAPLVEEWLFRGVLWDAIRVRSTALVALLLTSTLFAVWHWVSIREPSWTGSGGTPILMHFAFGALMGLLRWRFDSIGLGIALHALYNGLYTVTS